MFAKIEVMFPGDRSVDRGNWGRDDELSCAYILHNMILQSVLRRTFWKGFNMPYTFISHTKMSVVFETDRSTNDIS